MYKLYGTNMTRHYGTMYIILSRTNIITIPTVRPTIEPILLHTYNIPMLQWRNFIDIHTHKITHSWIFIVSKGWFFLQLNVSSCDLFSGCRVTCCNFPKKMSSDLLLFPFLTAVVSFCQPLFYANFCIPRQFSAVYYAPHLWATIIYLHFKSFIFGFLLQRRIPKCCIG